MDNQENKIILVFSGLIASGKDVCKKYIEGKYSADSFRFSNILRDALNRLGIQTSRENIIALSTWARQSFGEDLLAKAMARDVEKSESPLIIVDGARRLADIKYLSELPGFHLISVDADPEIRYKRMVARNENPGEADKTYEDFLADHQKETEITIPEIMATAEFSLDNNGTLDDLYAQIDKILEKVKD